MSRKKIPVAVIIGLILAVALDTVVQVAWKLAVANIPDGASIREIVVGALSHGHFYIAMLAFGAQLVNWLRVLARADLSYAQPFTALGYITVLTISSHSLHEQITGFKIAGVTLIFLGVFFISRTPYITAPHTSPS